MRLCELQQWTPVERAYGTEKDRSWTVRFPFGWNFVGLTSSRTLYISISVNQSSILISTQVTVQTCTKTYTQSFAQVTSQAQDKDFDGSLSED